MPDMKRFLKLATKHTFIFSIGDFAQKAVGFLLLPVYMRCLTPGDYGVLELLTILSLVFSGIVLQGIPTASFRAYSFDYGSDDLEQKDVIYTAYTYILLCSILLFSGLVASASFWSNMLFKQGDFSYYIRLVFITEFFRNTSAIPFVILRARLLSAWVAGITLFRVVVSATLTIWFVVFNDMGVLGVLYANLIVSILVFVFSPLIPLIIHRSFLLKISNEKLTRMLKFGWPLVPGIFAAWVMSSFDRYFLEHFSTRTELGLYAIGFKVSTILTIGFIGPFRKTWPAIFYPKARDSDAKEVFSRFATYFLLVGSIVSLGIICVSDHLIKLMGTRQYWDASLVVPVLVTGLLIHGLQATINMGLFVKDKTIYAPLIVISGACVNIVLNALLIPRYGMMGAGVGTMLSYVVMLTLTYGINQKFYPIEYEYRRLFHLVSVYTFIIIVNYGVHIQSFWWAIPFKTMLFISFIAFLFLTGFFTQQEVLVMRNYCIKYYSLGFKRAQ